jgi:hypothetical protein
MSRAEAKKLEILLGLKSSGYNLVDGDKPEIMLMSLGGGYTLECNVKKPSSEWKIIFNDGIETTEYPADSEKVVFTHRKDSDKLIGEYNATLRELFDDGVRVNEEPVKQPEEKVQDTYFEEPEQPTKTEWKAGGYKAKVQDATFEEVEPVRQITTKRPSRTIRGLTPRLAECGKIKIGRKGEVKTSSRGNQFRPPEKIDHFIVTTMEKTGNDDFAPDTEIMRKLGGNCKEIPVRLPYDDPSLNFPTSYAYYDSAACQCRGDGVTAITSAGECIDCNPETCQYVKDKKCKPNGVLSVILDDAPRVGGVYKFRTTGWNSINNIFSSMEFIRGLTNGLLAFLPLSLTLTPKNTVVPGTKTPTTIYMVNLEYRGSLKEMATAIQQTMSTRALTQYSVKDFEKLAEEALALPEAPEECKAIVEEFYPESVKVRA